MDDFDDSNEVVNSFVGPSNAGRIKRTPEGGIAILLINGTGAVSVKGQIVTAGLEIDESVQISHANEIDVIGAFYKSGIEDGQEAWVVVSGIADVLLADNTGSARGNWVEAAVDPGYSLGTETSPRSAPQHFREIGHSLQTVAATGTGTHVMCRIMMRFN